MRPAPPSPVPRAVALWTLVCAAAVACSPPPTEEPPHLLYSAEVGSTDNPFPDARLISAEGMRLELRKDWFRPFLMPKALTAKLTRFLGTYSEAANELRGANNLGPTLLRPSVALDRSSLSGVAHRLVKKGERFEVLEQDVAVEHSRDSLEGTDRVAPADFPEFIVVRPSVPLPSGAQGLLVIQRGLRTADGVELGRGHDHRDEPGAAERFAAAAEALGIPESDVLMALPLQAMDVLPVMKGLAAFTAQGAAPDYTIPPHGLVPDGNGNADLVDGVWTPADPDWGSIDAILVRWPFNNPASDVGAVISGTFKSRDLREAGVWRPDWSQDPAQAPEAELRFLLTLPKGPKPPGGFRVVIGGHGLNSRNTLELGDERSFCIEVAQVLASGGFGCLGIDAPEHGTRGNSLDFFALDDLRKARDNFRQMAFDQLQLSALAAQLDVDGDGGADLSAELGYFGNSLGAIMGGNFMSLDPRVKFGVLNVPGAGLSNILTSEEIRDQIGLLLVLESGLTFGSTEYYAAFPMFRTIGQLFLEQGDPANLGLAFRELSGRAVLLQEGVGDRTIPHLTTENLAGAMGVPEVTTGITGASPVRAFTRIDPVKFGFDSSFNGHNVFWEIEPARTQVMDFLTSSGTTLTVE